MSAVHMSGSDTSSLKEGLRPATNFDFILICVFLAFEPYYLIFALNEGLIPILSVLEIILLILVWVRRSNLLPNESQKTRLVHHRYTKQVIIFFLAYGSLIGVYKVGIFNTAISLRFVVLPYFFYRIVMNFSANKLVSLYIFLGYTIVLNAFAAIFEVIVGPEFLVSHYSSFIYGTTVRQIGSSLRPPGLMRTNVYLGFYAATFLIIYVYSNFLKKRLSTFQRFIFFLSGATCLVLSTSRSAYLFLILSWIMLKRAGIASKLLRRIIIPVAIIVIVFFVYIPDITTVLDRLSVWADLSNYFGFIGNGLGSIGTATGSRFSSASQLNYRIGYASIAFADNYYLSLIFQFGWIAGIGVIGTLIASAIRAVKLSTGIKKAYIRGIFSGLFLNALFLDIGEYYPIFIFLIHGYLILKATDSEASK